MRKFVDVCSFSWLHKAATRGAKDTEGGAFGSQNVQERNEELREKEGNKREVKRKNERRKYSETESNKRKKKKSMDEVRKSEQKYKKQEVLARTNPPTFITLINNNNFVAYIFLISKFEFNKHSKEMLMLYHLKMA